MNRHFEPRSWLLLASALLLGAAAQAQTTAAPQGVAGYLNPKTGVFTAVNPRAQALAPEQVPLASATASGTIKFVYAITLKSGIPTTNTILCSATLSVRDTDFTSDISYYDTKAVEATRSGTTASCTVSIPYSWLLPDVADSTISLSYSVSTYGTSTTSVVDNLSRRTHNGNLNSITVPANGATITRNVKVTL